MEKDKLPDIRLLLAQNMKRGRETLHLSQLQLADRIGCSVSYIGDIEVGKKFPSAEMFARISKALSFEPYQLLLGEGPQADVAVQVAQIRQELEAKVIAALAEAGQKYQGILSRPQ